MKKLLFILFLLPGLMIFSGCSDWLDLRPESEIVLEDYWQDENDVNQVLAGCYRAMTEDGYMERILVWGEVRSDNVVSNTAGAPYEMFRLINGEITVNNAFSKWGSMYSVINYCNTLLLYGPEVVEKDENFSQAQFNSIKAEVLTIRALTYFYLVRTFGKVPWIETASVDDNQDYQVAASPDVVILNRLLEDLSFAEKNSRDRFENDELTKGRITRSAVRALMADIYLWLEDYENAVKYCDLVLTNEDLELVPGEELIREVFFMGNSVESIFELQFDRDVQNNNRVNEYLGFYQVPNGFWAFPMNLIQGEGNPLPRIFDRKEGTGTESANDFRKKDFLYPFTSENYSAFKYSGAFRTESADGSSSSYAFGTRTPNWIIYRLADILLLKAEALVELDRLAEALTLVNQVYGRMNYEDNALLELSNYSTKERMRELVLRERQRELMFEGKRWFDLVRYGRRLDDAGAVAAKVAMKFSGGTSLTWQVQDALYLPIHIDELNSNQELEQNPFYDIESETINK
ncbi:RagB/SusD family nutrient uptake outer membrane protein [Geofilum rhodophaeum]|uniref:RagB/SusD family nutrient uptake outer membrane protein n=1 Tax=Geofilum rhodophaeum TaxID=1965019 RepID=UPI000B524E44|nr:RagB/SusD family nutrient uptake outer membrane protein [Geofilum rhodophaeum]